MTATPADTGKQVGEAREPVLRVDDLKAYYRTRHFGVAREVKAVDGVSFEVRHNEIYGIAGESSSGKSTLLKAVAAAMRPPDRNGQCKNKIIMLAGARIEHHVTSRGEFHTEIL